MIAFSEPVELLRKADAYERAALEGGPRHLALFAEELRALAHCLGRSPAAAGRLAACVNPRRARGAPGPR